MSPFMLKTNSIPNHSLSRKWSHLCLEKVKEEKSHPKSFSKGERRKNIIVFS